MKNIDSAIQLLSDHIKLLACPLCRQAMTLQSNSLLCSGGHCFDIARQGYVNMLAGKHSTDYDDGLFESRRAVCADGFFDPMLEVVAELIAGQGKGQCMILDAGCGEGSHLADLIQRLLQKGVSAQGAGIDISKAGVLAAAAHFPGIIWAVADIARMPFADHSFDAIVNILSPSNYEEFDRVLRPDGLLVKVLPGSGYLRELRQAFHAQEEYTNEPVASRFAECFEIVDSKSLCYKKILRGEALHHLVRMTPLSWGVAQEQLQTVLDQEMAEITVEFLVMAGRKRKFEV